MTILSKDILPEFFSRVEKRARRKPSVAPAQKVYRHLRKELADIAPLKGTPLYDAAVKVTLEDCEAKQKKLLRKRKGGTRMSFDVVMLPAPVFQALLNAPVLSRCDRIWLEQRGMCACGTMIVTRPIWLRREKAVCEPCRVAP